MTKEELEKEAKDSWWNDNNCSGALPTEKIYECGYLASAEPREKRIEELEKENAELKERIKSEHEIEARKNNSLISQLTKAKEHNEWHYVKDGDLPKDDNDVLVLLKDETMQVDYYFSKVGWNISVNADVIAWKEIVLPKPKLDVREI